MKFFTICFAFVISSISAYGQLVWSNFQVSGPSEAFYSPFDRIGGTTSQHHYTGFVAIEASGVTTSYPGEYSDAVWTFVSPFGWTVPYYSEYNFSYSFNGNCAYMEGDGRGVARLITFIDGVGDVPAWTNPDYTSSHQYLFIINIGPGSHRLTLGPGDGGTWDNSGGLDLRLWQVTPVPEPTTIAILGIGLLAAIKKRRRSPDSRSIK